MSDKQELNKLQDFQRFTDALIVAAHLRQEKNLKGGENV